MNSYFRSTLNDIINSSYSEKRLTKSKSNNLLTNPHLEKRLKTSYSTPKYNNVINSYNYISNKENIQDKLNRSFTELGIVRKPKINSSNKKSIFDNINNTIYNYFGQNYKQYVDYENILNNINRKNKKEINNILFRNNRYNIGLNDKENCLYTLNNKNNYFLKRENTLNGNTFQIKKKIFYYTNEIRDNSNPNTSLLNRPISTFKKNISSYSSPFYNGRVNNLVKGEISKLFDYNNSKTFFDGIRTFDFFGNNFYKKNKYNNFGLKKTNFNNREINNYLRGFNYNNNNKGRNVFKDF